MSLALGAGAMAQDAPAPTAAVQPPSAGQSAADRSEADQTDYRLGAGDKLRIGVFGEDTLSGEFLVPGGGGTIAFPLIGDVQASGLTVNQLQTEIESKLRPDYLKDPHVSIEVLNYRPFYILGEVMKPGEYPYTSRLTVLNAVATANGFTYRADTRKVYIKRANAQGELEYRLDATTAVQPGDTIRIGERFF
ncbi:MAG TPA: polysaccharide biosynthesis/export family protein [Caulobacteraceae bacterium]|nr:polysaccharide biosynthesis/export family protein [Caulobacteraceae bacterium]